MPDINAAYQWAITTCNAPNVGYSQAYRNEQYYNGAIRYDCSSFIWYALKNGGFGNIGSYPFTTASMRPILISSGFTQVNINGEWKAGDILWRSGHTEMVYTGGIASGVTMGAHSDSYSLPKQVSINTSVTPASKWTQIYRYGNGATGGGLSIYVVAAMCGCWWQESGVNPGIWESLIPCAWDFQYDFTHKGGFGVGQWTNYGTSHGRCYNLHEWVTSNGYADGDGTGQMLFLVHEDYWVNSSHKRGNYTTLSEFLSSTSTDLGTLVWDFLACWEGVAGNAYENRLSHAQTYLNYIRQHMDDDPSQYSWVSANRYLSEAETLNNVMCVYFHFYGYNIDPKPDPSTWKRSMPVWMMCRYHL